jgi:hypothetical protein
MVFSRLSFIALLLLALASCTTNIDYTFDISDEPGDLETDIWVDSFTQVGSYENIDILWVIDRSCSMNDNDAELLSGVESMMNSLSSDINWRLKIITAGDRAVVQSDSFPLTRGATYSDALDMLNTLPNDGGETGFAALYDYIMHDPYAQTWLRHNAALLVVFVSDEEEQSNMLVSDFTSWYRDLRASVYVSSIVNVDAAESVCIYPPFSSNIGYKYIEATDYFKGNVIDICSTDWSSGVAEATSRIEPYEFYTLTHIPYDDTIVIFQDGTPYNAWYYSPLDNTVYFDETPAEGHLIEIGYSIKEYSSLDSESSTLLTSNK